MTMIDGPGVPVTPASEAEREVRRQASQSLHEAARLESEGHRDALDRSFNAPKHRADVEPELGPVAQHCGQCVTCNVCGEAIRLGAHLSRYNEGPRA